MELLYDQLVKARREIDDNRKRPRHKCFTIKDYQQLYLIEITVCRKYNITYNDLVSPPDKKARPAHAIGRQAVSFLIKDYYGDNITTTQIAKELGYKQHSQVSRNIRTITDVISVDKEERRIIEECMAAIREKKKKQTIVFTVYQIPLFQ